MTWPTLVLLPGLDGTGELFAPLLRELPPDWRTQVLRYPHDAGAGYDELAELAWRALPAGRLVLLGESFSGPIAVRLAARLGSRLHALVLCCTFVRNPRPTLSALFGWLPWMPPARTLPSSWSARLLLGTKASQEAQELLRDALADLPAAVVLSRLKAVAAVDAVQELQAVRASVLYLQASQDVVVPHAALAQIKSVLPSLVVMRLAGPHGLLQSSPRAAAEAISGFLRSVPG